MTAPASRVSTPRATVATRDLGVDVRLMAGFVLGVVLVLLALALIGPPAGG